MRNFQGTDLNLSATLGSLAFVRMLAFAIVAAMAASALSQESIGSYTSKGGTPQPWKINGNHTLLWSGTPYLPVGLHIDGNAEEVTRAKAAGFNDVIVDLPAGGTGWDETIKALDTAGMRYLISFSSLAPMADGVTIEPSGYRITGIKKAQKLSVKLPGASSALAVIVNKRDSSVAKVQRVEIANGELLLDVKPMADLEQILLLYPHMRSLEQPDLWDALDEHRDRVLATLRNHVPGAGLRGLVNPLGRLASWTKSESHFVPTSTFFRIEFAAYLKQKYRSLETAMKSWSMTASGIDSFDKLAKLAPLWSGPTRGIPQLWDTDTDKIYAVNSARSQIWYDIQDAISMTASRRYGRFTEAIQSVVDVPLIQEWVGWMPLYEVGSPAIDGIGMHAFGTTPSALLESASRATSSILRWRKPGWLLATEIDPGSGPEAAKDLGNVLEDLSSLGARGWFLKSSSPDIVKSMASQLSHSGNANLAEYSPNALFYPENAFNPATPQRLPGGKWWLPSPASGNRLNLGSHFFAYRWVGGNKSFTAMWTDLGTVRVKLKMMAPKAPGLTFTSIDGTAVDPKFSKDGVQLTIGSLPILIEGTEEIPIPDLAYAETLAKMTQLFATADGLLIDVTEPRFLFRDALAGFDRNPGGSFSVMQQQYERVTLRLARYMWIEAEATKAHNFSEALPSAGCSNGGMLSLKTQLASPEEGYFADYTVGVKSSDDVEIWIAARIPASERQNVTVNLAGENFTVQSEPVSPYGQGFAWYNLGTTKLGGAQTKLRLLVNSRSADLAFDAIALVPGRFQPKGVALPDAIVFTEGKKK
jgi:hypothetical protein